MWPGVAGYCSTMTIQLRVTGLDHTVLCCSNVEESIKFYCETLGLEPVRVDEWRRGEVPFPSARISPTTIIDLFAERPDGVNFDHICLVLEPTDLDAVAAEFPGSRRADRVFGAQGYASSVYVTDPDGNTVELRCYPA
jgi:catechol 2,3-dioxygenase-like lactoylglutathione lyase family enzyme